jgi:HlyD family secretion protein
MHNSAGSALVKWLVIIALVAGGGYAGFRYWSRTGTAAVEYRTAAVTRGEVVQVVTANGAITPVRDVQVGCEISGTIREIRVDFNSKVKAGDVIAQIDPATYQRALLQAEAELANAQASYKLAQINFRRAKELFASSLISQSDYDQTDASLSQAEAMVKMREANVERTKVDLSRTTIYAPIDGVVISRKVEVGQTVAASFNAPTLFLIAEDLARMRIEAAVAEADIGGVTEGQAVNFTVDAFPRRQFKGTIEQVRFEPTTNQSVVTYTTVVTVDNRDLKLRPGMTANASIVLSERTNAFKIANAALRFRPPEGAVVTGLTNGTNNVMAPLAAQSRLGWPNNAGPIQANASNGWLRSSRRTVNARRRSWMKCGRVSPRPGAGPGAGVVSWAGPAAVPASDRAGAEEGAASRRAVRSKGRGTRPSTCSRSRRRRRAAKPTFSRP